MPKEIRISIVATTDAYKTSAIVDGVEVFHRVWTRTPTGSTAGKNSQDPWDLYDEEEDNEALPDSIESAEGLGADLMRLCYTTPTPDQPDTTHAPHEPDAPIAPPDSGAPWGSLEHSQNLRDRITAASEHWAAIALDESQPVEVRRDADARLRRAIDLLTEINREIEEMIHAQG